MSLIENQKTTWIAGAIVVLVLIALWLLAPKLSNNPSIEGTTDTATTTEQVATTTTTQGTPTRQAKTTTSKAVPPQEKPGTVVGVAPISYLLGLTQPVVCTIATQSAFLKRSGTAYVSGGKLRADLTSYIDGVLTHASMIDDREHLLVWEEGSRYGLRLPAPLSTSGSTIQNNGGLDLAATVSFSCNPWAPDESVFIPPSSIQFSNNP